MKISKKNKKIELEVVTNELIMRNPYRFFKREKLVYVTSGSLELEYNGKSISIPEKTILFAERGLYRYIVKPIDRFKLYEIDIIPEYMGLFIPRIEIGSYRNGFVETMIANVNLNYTMDKIEESGNSITIAKFLSIFSKIIAHQSSLSEKIMWYKKLHPSFIKSMDLIYVDMSHNLSVADISESVGISTYKLSRLFLKYFDTPLHKWLNIQRIMLAKMYLYSTDMSIGNISENVGFGDTSNFISKYKKRYGITPLKERKIREVKNI